MTMKINNTFASYPRAYMQATHQAEKTIRKAEETKTSEADCVELASQSARDTFTLTGSQSVDDQADKDPETVKNYAEVIENNSEEESTTVSGSVAVNVGKTARKIAAARTKAQLRAILAEIKADMQEVKAGMSKGWCNESELEKVNSLLAMAQNRMGKVEDREATPEEEMMFSLASLM